MNYRLQKPKTKGTWRNKKKKKNSALRIEEINMNKEVLKEERDQEKMIEYKGITDFFI